MPQPQGVTALGELFVNLNQGGLDARWVAETDCLLGLGVGDGVAVVSGVASESSYNSTSDDLTAAQAFDQVFWPVYPRKIAKFAARQAWSRLHLKDDDQKSLDAIMAGLHLYLTTEWAGREARFIPHAATWINQHRWEDGP